MKTTRRSFLCLAGAGTLAAVIPKSLFSQDPQEDSHEVSFVQITDSHIPDAIGIERTHKVLNSVNNLSLPYDMIIHTGDISNGRGKRDDMVAAKDLLSFNKKILFVPGNHDVTFDHSDKHEALFEKVFGPCYFSMNPVREIRFTFFNSQAISDRASELTRNRAWKRLKEILSPSIPTILFCHATGLSDFYKNKNHSGWREETMSKWTSIMKDGGVFAVLAGHFHRDEMHVCGGIPFHISAPIVGWWGRQSSYRHWVLKNGKLSYRTIYV